MFNISVEHYYMSNKRYDVGPFKNLRECILYLLKLQFKDLRLNLRWYRAFNEKYTLQNSCINVEKPNQKIINQELPHPVWFITQNYHLHPYIFNKILNELKDAQLIKIKKHFKLIKNNPWLGNAFLEATLWYETVVLKDQPRAQVASREQLLQLYNEC